MDLWFKNMEYVEDNFHRDYFQVYFTMLSPAFLRRQSDVDRLNQMLAKYEASDKTLFVKLLKEEIDSIEELISINPN